MRQVVTTETAGKVYERLFLRHLPWGPLKLLDLEWGTRHFSPHCRLESNPQNSQPPLLHLPLSWVETAQSWGQSTIFLVSRTEAGGKVGGGSKLLWNKNMYVCMVAVCYSNWYCLHICGWFLVSVFSKFLFLWPTAYYEKIFAINHEKLQNKIFKFIEML